MASAFVQQAEYARHRGVSRKTVTGWKQKGRIVLTDAGLVDVVASDARLDERPETYRGGVTKGADATVTGNSRPAATAGNADLLTKSPAEIAEALDWSTAEAQRVKEVYLALIRKQEYEVGHGKLVEIEAVAILVEREYSVVRERLLAIPGKLAAKLVGLDRAEIDAALFAEVSEALNELHDPGDRTDGLGGIVPALVPGAERPEAAAAAQPDRMG